MIISEPAAVGDGDAMGGAAEIGQHLFGSAERWLGVRPPSWCAGIPRPQVVAIARDPWSRSIGTSGRNQLE